MCVCVQWVIVSVCQWRCGCLSTTYICQPQLYGDFVFFIYFFFILSHTFTELSQPPSNLMMYERNNFEDYIQTYPIFIQWASEKKKNEKYTEASKSTGRPASDTQTAANDTATDEQQKMWNAITKAVDTHTQSDKKKNIRCGDGRAECKESKKKDTEPGFLGHNAYFTNYLWDVSRRYQLLFSNTEPIFPPESFVFTAGRRCASCSV